MKGQSVLSVAGTLEAGRILIVEDDPDFAASLVDLLDPEKFQVQTARNGAEALALLDVFPAELALIDIRLGAENGVDLMARLRAKRPALLCILMTAYAAVDSAVLAVRHGAHDYLTKPIDPQALKELMEGSLSRVRHSGVHERSQRLAALGQLAAGVAHDMNNVLAAIVSESENGQALVGVTDRQSELRDILKVIQTAGIRGGEFTRQLLVFTRGKAPLSPCTTPNEVLRHAAALLRGGLPQGVVIELELCAENPAIALDGSQLEQVALNLLLNARDAIKPPGWIRLQSRIERHPREPHGVYGLVVTVIDSGIGIPPENQSRIFEPFFSSKAEGVGTGLGLSTLYGLVRRVNGEISVNSQVGVGTRFDVWIPNATAADSGAARPPTAASPTTEGLRTVLLCDDDVGVLSALTRLLKASGHEVLAAGNVAAAMQLWSTHKGRIDFAMIDLRLGTERGSSIAAALHSERPTLPIVLMSGDPGEIGRGQADNPAVTWLQKPFSLADLRAALPQSSGSPAPDQSDQ